MSWLALIQSALTIVAAVLSYLRERRLVDGAVAEAVNKHLQGALDDIAKANEARDSVRVDAALHPERLRDDDGFRRD
jgi:hypothetical protein